MFLGAGRELSLAILSRFACWTPVLGGGLLSGSPRMRRTVIEAVEQNLSRAARAALHIGAPALEEDAAVVGAALIAREALSR